MIPPKKFYKMSRPAQEEFAIREMQKAYAAGDQWKQLSIQAKKKVIVDPDPRPDEENLKA